MTSIEKNGGCNHMTCRKCNFEFCWLCSQNWRTHSDCHVYREEQDLTQNQARMLLQRYLFHFERYENHAKSLKNQKKVKEKAAVMTEFMRESALMGFAESKCFDLAIETLRESRHVLMNTYIFAYYVKRNNHLDMFEENQRDLELAVEKLCSLFELEDLSGMDTEYIKTRVQDLTRYCNKRRQALIDHVEEGFEKGNCWVYNESGCD